MAKKGGTVSRYYAETRGLKTSGGQTVKSGTVLTRQGAKWKPGLNVVGHDHLTAAIDGEVYFTKKKSSYNRVQTVINIRPAALKASVKDDLKIVEGIGPKYADVLNAAGVKTFAQLAKLNQDQIKDILVKAEMRVPASVESWAEQAQLAAVGKMNELKKLQDKLNAGRKE